MLVNPNNNKLPPEILNLIFKNLAPYNQDCSDIWSYKTEGNPVYSGNRDIKSCLRVCKSWGLVIKKSFKYNNNQIKVNDYMLSTLVQDIPKFGHTIKSILLITQDDEDEDDTNLINWKKILTMCTNLVSLEFSMMSGEELKYLSILRLRGIELKNIQRIFIKRLDIYPPSTSDAYLRTQIPFRATITSLYILYPAQLPITIKLYGGLTSFISKFPNLTNLAIKDTSSTEYEGFNIKKLLQAAPHLQKLHLYGLSLIADNFQINEFSNIRLTHLKIKVATMKLTSLNHLTSSLLSKVDHLYLHIGKLVSKDLSKKESKKLLHDFQTSLLDINEVYVKIININKFIKLSESVTSSILFESDEDITDGIEDYHEYQYNYPWYCDYPSFYYRYKNANTEEEEEEEESEDEGPRTSYLM